MNTKSMLLLSALMVSVSTFAVAQGNVPSAAPCVSQAQLMDALAKDGYTDIKLSEVQPNVGVPHPDVSCRSNPADAATTATHKGWNGTATKGGKVYNIYVDATGKVTAD